jgi:hypothetical protein
MIDRPRGVAQSGSAPGWGPGGRRFKSCLPDVRKSWYSASSCLGRRCGFCPKGSIGAPFFSATAQRSPSKPPADRERCSADRGYGPGNLDATAAAAAMRSQTGVGRVARCRQWRLRHSYGVWRTRHRALGGVQRAWRPRKDWRVTRPSSSRSKVKYPGRIRTPKKPRRRHQ